MVEIVAYSDENAYTIFETMNDRGLNLTPSEMLKGFYFHAFIREINAKRQMNSGKSDDGFKNYDKDEDQRFSSHGCVLNMLIQYARVKLVQK